MSLTTVNLTGTAYQDELDLILNILKLAEGEHPNHYDGKGIPTIGYGYALLVTDSNQVYSLRTGWENIVQTQTGITLSTSVINETNAALRVIRDILNDPNKTAQDAKNAIAAYKANSTSSAFDFSTNTNGSLTGTEAEGLLEYVYNEHLRDVQTLYSGHINPQSKEMLALASIHYNTPSLVTQVGAPSLHAAITSNPSSRARAWFEIRYQTNGSNNGIGDDGTAKRRYFESQMFGLYDNANSVGGAEADTIIEFLTSTFSGSQTFLEIMVAYETTRGHMASASVSDYNLQGTNYCNLSFQKIFLPIANELAEHFSLSGLTNPDISSSPDYLEGQAILAAIGGININNEVVMGLETGGVIQATNDGNDLLIAIRDTGQTLSGGNGNDVLIGAAGIDTLNGGDNNDLLIGNAGSDKLFGGEGEDILYGGGGNDKLYGGENDDILDGGKGNDTMAGGTGNDTYYVDSQSDVIIENAGEGDLDTIISSIDYVLTNQHEHIEILQLDQSANTTAQNATGNDFDNTILGNDLDNILIGGDGLDILYGGEGNDTLMADPGTYWYEFDTGWHRWNGFEYMFGGNGFDSYYSHSSNRSVIVDTDGKGELFIRASDISDVHFKLAGGTFKQSGTSNGKEYDEYTYRNPDGGTDAFVGFRIEYEADGSQKLVMSTMGGLQIPDFYNGMLGINLVGGRVKGKANAVVGIGESLTIEDGFSPFEQELIKSVLSKIFNYSETARAMISEYIGSNRNNINIGFSDNGIYTSSHARENSTNIVSDGITSASDPDVIYLDLNWLKGNTYISTTGKAVTDTLETALIHELIHLIDDLSDPLSHGEKGDTVEVANTIYREMGLAEQVSYLAYDPAGNTHIANFEYTNGEEIDRAFTLLSENLDANDVDTSTGGNLDDLIIGNERANSLSGGEGRDFLYGNEGDDRLLGEDGDDELHGGSGADLIYGGSGSDTAAYTTSRSGININLAGATVGGGDAEGDTLSNIENISGSAYNDNITGDAQDNRLEGLDGDDIISGGFGDDELIGGWQ